MADHAFSFVSVALTAGFECISTHAVLRILLAALCALGLALSPAATVHAFPTPETMLNCPMTRTAHEEMMQAAMDHADDPIGDEHNRMNCCTPLCDMPAPLAVTHKPAVTGDATRAKAASYAIGPATALPSVGSTGPDPPPKI